MVNRYFGLFLVFMLCTLQVFSQATIKHITTVEGNKEYELSNGLRVLLIPDPAQTNIVINIVYKVGSRHEGYGETGMAHLLEHMLFKQCGKFTDIKKAIADKGAFANGTTWYDRTNYYEVLSASDENLSWALDMEADRMVNSKILAEELKKEFSVVRNEFEIGENNQSGVLNERVLSTMFLWHNYGNSTIGSKEDIERVKAENLKVFYQKYYQPDNAVLVIAGKFDEQKALDYVKQYFGPIPRPSRILQAPYTVEPPQDGERFVSLRRTGDIQYISMGYHTPALADKDYAANDALIEILTNNPSGVLYKKLIDTKLATKVSGYSQTLYDPGFSYFEVEVPKEKNLDSTKQAMVNAMDGVAKMEITEEDLIRAINVSLKNIENTSSKVINFSIALTEFIGAGDWRLWYLYRDRIENLKIDEVKAVAQKYYKPSNRTLGVFTPESNPDRTVVAETPDIEKLLAGYTGKAIAAEKAEFETSIENIRSHTEYGTLPNGAKYALLEKPTKGDKINATITFKWGAESSLMNKSTVSGLMARLLKTGTTTKPKKQINDELDKLKSTISFNGTPDELYVNIATDKVNLHDVLALLDDILKRPGFDSTEFEKLIVSSRADIETNKNDPQTVASEKLSKLTSNYPKGHPNYSLDSDERLAQLEKIKLSDLKAYYQGFYGANNSVSSFVGELDKPQIKKYLQSSFGTWNSKSPYTEVKPILFETKETRANINTPDKTNAMLLAQLNINLSKKSTDYAAAYMANELLGGGAFLSSRIAQRLRENEGMSYGAGSFLSVEYKYDVAGWGVYAFFNPIYQNRLDSALNEEVDKALTKGFTQDELDNAINSTLQQNKTLLGLNNNLASMLKSYLNDGRDLNEFTEFETRIKTLKLDAVNAALKKYFNKSKLVKVYAGDFEKNKVLNEVKKS
ncbi:MAG: pitrilysin family protein [Saprospiraceae bacterium]|nr:pitrilysin family protein [Saprospiraceae bacterium]